MRPSELRPENAAQTFSSIMWIFLIELESCSFLKLFFSTANTMPSLHLTAAEHWPMFTASIEYSTCSRLPFGEKIVIALS